MSQRVTTIWAAGVPALHRSFADIQFDMVLCSYRCNHAGYCKILHPPFDWKIFREGPPVIRSPPQISNQSPPLHSNATNLLCINLCFRLTLVELFWKPQCHHFSCRGWGKRGGWVGPFTPKIAGKKPPFEALSASSAGATLRYLDLRGLAAAPPYGDGKSVTRG